MLPGECVLGHISAAFAGTVAEHVNVTYDYSVAGTSLVRVVHIAAPEVVAYTVK